MQFCALPHDPDQSVSVVAHCSSIGQFLHEHPYLMRSVLQQPASLGVQLVLHGVVGKQKNHPGLQQGEDANQPSQSALEAASQPWTADTATPIR